MGVSRSTAMLVALGVMALAVECAAQPQPCTLEELARLGGAFASVSSNGHTAVVSVANRLLVFDVSDPTDPVEVGRLEGVEGVLGHRMAGSLAFVLVADELRVIDLSNPASPIQVGAVTPIPGAFSWDRPAVDGSTVYLVYRSAATKLVSIDVTDPANPVVLDSIDGPESTRAYVSAGGGVVGCSLGRSGAGNQVWFVDASDPADLRSASIVGTTQYAEDLACNGTIACVFNWFNIDIYDTSNPYRPSIIGGATPFAWFTVEIELAGDTLFASVGYDPGGGALHAFDVSNPAQPMPLGTPVGSGRSAPWSVAPSGRGALMLDDSALKAVSVDPTFAVVGTYPSEGRADGADVEGDHLVITSSTGTYFYDVSDPRSPVRTGAVVGRGGYGTTVRIQGDLAYVVANSVLWVYDLSQPTGPALISATAVPCLSLLDVDGTVGIGACTSRNEFIVFDLSDPMRPVVSPALTLPPYVYPEDVAIEGDIALVAADTLYVLDVSDPTSPRVVSSLLSRPWRVALANGIAYVSLLRGSGAIVDLRNPGKPSVIANPPLPHAMDLAVSGDLLYASVHASPAGLWVFDVSDPNAVSVVGTFNAPYQARAVAADGFGHVALVRGGYGLSLLEACRPCYPDCDDSGTLDLFDFLCFQSSFVNQNPYACDCDTTTGPGVCDMLDFLCFQDAFVAGCP